MPSISWFQGSFESIPVDRGFETPSNLAPAVVTSGRTFGESDNGGYSEFKLRTKPVTIVKMSAAVAKAANAPATMEEGKWTLETSKKKYIFKKIATAKGATEA